MVKCVSTKSCKHFGTDKRHGNLLSLINIQEIFNACKIISLQTQSKEIASGMQQWLAKLIVTTPHTEPRNDELSCVGEFTAKCQNSYKGIYAL
jgi:hypothetical protein